MRILFLSTWFPFPPDNGSKLRVYYLLRALTERHQVTLISFAFGSAQPEALDELLTRCQNVKTVAVNPFVANQVSVIRTFISPSPVAFRPIPAMNKLVADTLAHCEFDLLIASTLTMAAYLLDNRVNTPCVLEEHNSLTRWMWERFTSQTGLLPKVRSWASWQKTRRYEGQTFSQFDIVTMVSEQDRVISQASLPGFQGQVAVIPNGVDCLHNRPGLTEGCGNRLIYNGALTYQANFDAMEYFLRAVYPLIQQQVPDVRLTITGSTEDVDLRGLALDDSVCLSGYVADVRLPVAEADVCVVPLREGGGTRLKVLEAMALGTAVVATSKGAEGLAVEHNHHLLIADDPIDFAQATRELLINPKLRQRLTANARLLVETQYDWNFIGQQFVTLMETAVAQHHLPQK